MSDIKIESRNIINEVYDTKKRTNDFHDAVFLHIIEYHIPHYPFAADDNKPNVVRVGFYECPFNIKDENGHLSGYAYCYRQDLAAYTGWEYEYVEASWPELLQMLKEGKIDLLSDVSYTPERENQMLFSSYSMGTEGYYAKGVSREISKG